MLLVKVSDTMILFSNLFFWCPREVWIAVFLPSFLIREIWDGGGGVGEGAGGGAGEGGVMASRGVWGEGRKDPRGRGTSSLICLCVRLFQNLTNNIS